MPGRDQQNEDGLAHAHDGLAPLLWLALAGQFALTMFERTFALLAQAKFEFGPPEVGYVFVVCELVMAEGSSFWRARSAR